MTEQGLYDYCTAICSGIAKAQHNVLTLHDVQVLQKVFLKSLEGLSMCVKRDVPEEILER